jgi:hypothetical protein
VICSEEEAQERIRSAYLRNPQQSGRTGDGVALTDAEIDDAIHVLSAGSRLSSFAYSRHPISRLYAVKSLYQLFSVDGQGRLVNSRGLVYLHTYEIYNAVAQAIAQLDPSVVSPSTVRRQLEVHGFYVRMTTIEDLLDVESIPVFTPGPPAPVETPPQTTYASTPQTDNIHRSMILQQENHLHALEQESYQAMAQSLRDVGGDVASNIASNVAREVAREVMAPVSNVWNAMVQNMRDSTIRREIRLQAATSVPSFHTPRIRNHVSRSLTYDTALEEPLPQPVQPEQPLFNLGLPTPGVPPFAARPNQVVEDVHHSANVWLIPPVMDADDADFDDDDSDGEHKPAAKEPVRSQYGVMGDDDNDNTIRNENDEDTIPDEDKARCATTTGPSSSSAVPTDPATEISPPFVPPTTVVADGDLSLDSTVYYDCVSVLSERIAENNAAASASGHDDLHTTNEATTDTEHNDGDDELLNIFSFAAGMAVLVYISGAGWLPATVARVNPRRGSVRVTFTLTDGNHRPTCHEITDISEIRLA